ncbi:uncharacterized protein LTR77_005292 [Saxophila tyrrhenica]|uniref:Ecp2 effector protein-like domain-containing protein n=1 Tax=Saxophila tyrrhenica TaxID=1690608 RepID=A0AAV9PEL5_9PEZI|nr:hypothetical protein LTR77_005292 [Saxophila tyrrhenica]
MLFSQLTLLALVAICNAAPAKEADPVVQLEFINAEDDPTLAALLDYPDFNNTTETDVLEKRKAVNDCGPSTFIDQGSAASPFVDDCYCIGANIGGGGTFEVGCGEGQLVKAKCRTCAWGARCKPQGLNGARIGNADIYNTIDTSIDKFASGGKVGSLGQMKCDSAQGGGHSQNIRWGVYHT